MNHRLKLIVLSFLLLAALGVSPAPSSAQPRRETSFVSPSRRPAAISDGRPADLQAFSSKSYTIYTNLRREEARPFGTHMDAVFAEYSKRFSRFGKAQHGPMPLYLFRTQDQYLIFLKMHGINGANTEGLFFVQPDIQGLATWTQGKSLSHTYAVLQHEGFHQFAFNYIGTNLPIWINEGIAQYFEDGVLVGDKMYVGFANGRRIASVQVALNKNHTIPFNKLLQMTEDQWHEMVIAGGWDAGLLYDQSWSIVFFLITADDGRYREAFENYLVLVAHGRDSSEAFRTAFGSEDTNPFRAKWEKFARSAEPDAITVALSRMEFLGQGLRYLHDHNEPSPQSLDELRDRLQRIDFQMMRTMLGVTMRYSARDDSLYRFPRAKGTENEFKLLPPEMGGMPARITAPGLRPEPTLMWQRDDQGELVQDIIYK